MDRISLPIRNVGVPTTPAGTVGVPVVRNDHLDRADQPEPPDHLDQVPRRPARGAARRDDHPKGLPTDHARERRRPRSTSAPAATTPCPIRLDSAVESIV